MTQAVLRESSLSKIVRALVDALDPERVVLFGSWARGEERPDSDIDLFVEVLPARTLVTQREEGMRQFGRYTRRSNGEWTSS